ncbi:unnamed protein product [Parascedosporium putredinis]|uniref:DUF1524 domain-containing protein n=1 Tax=Parascedosporium putredinis TaxID=1442378 RepID=A0A9P1MAT8_9PEZI|nr:unnamed protein product [Parascedosporium putredinis]CAI7994743.1 unnamed protein product [Parascedosporium putredinis]
MDIGGHGSDDKRDRSPTSKTQDPVLAANATASSPAMKTSAITAVIAWGAVALAAPAPAPAPAAPGVPTEAAARTQLAALTVAASGSGTGYSRDLFPTGPPSLVPATLERLSLTVSLIIGVCREYVLQRDGTGVVVNSACTATSGTWKSPYDGASWTAASDVDIDHMVPLKNAWISGASSWTTAKRQLFANDIDRPQLFYCTYAKSWIRVKNYWALTITSAEKTALTSMLDYC